jgi:hypothetical protein
MKQARFALLIVLLFALFADARAGDPVWVTQGQTQAKTPSLLFKHHNKQAIDLCREYKRKIIAGSVLMPAGACAMGGGLYMMYKGSYNIFGQLSNGTYEYHNQPETRRGDAFICGGTALFIAGLAMAPGGFIMATVARTKYCKYCRAGGAMYFTPSQTGMGLAFNF